MDKLPISLKYYIFNYLELSQYNHIELYFKIKPNYKFYFKNNEYNYTLDEICYDQKLININLVKYLHTIVNDKCTVDAMTWASSNDHLEVVQYLHTIVKAKCTVDAMDYASENGVLLHAQ